jgi:hypothetical protein
MHEADGVVLIYNPDAPSQDQQIGDWFEFFVRKNNLREDQCIVFAYRSNPSNGDKFRPREFPPPPPPVRLFPHSSPSYSTVIFESECLPHHATELRRHERNV